MVYGQSNFPASGCCAHVDAGKKSNITKNLKTGYFMVVCYND